MSSRLALARLAFMACVFLTPGATANAAAKHDARRKSPPAMVTLENKRAVALQSFLIVMAGAGRSPEIIVGKLEKPLPAGEKIDMKLEKPKGCVFEARWKFEDADDVGAVDLCNDAHIVLVD